jgi:hypothetical protein
MSHALESVALASNKAIDRPTEGRRRRAKLQWVDGHWPKAAAFRPSVVVFTRG